MIKQETIDKVLEAANIVEVVSEFVTLKRAGANFKGHCPFHTDKDPSFVVSPAKNICHCFACGEGGSPVGFIMNHEGLTFPEAIKYLGKKYGIEVDEKPPTEEEQKEYLQKQSMWIANELLSKEYQRQLELHPKARDYAYNRWGEEYCKLAGIGYCPMNAVLVDKLGISENVSEDLKLKTSKGKDFFFGRITISIKDQQNRIIGFTARLFDKFKYSDGKEPPKYINPSDNLIYKKSKSIFGIDTAYREARKLEAFYLVEGAPDCMRLQSIGISNAVAPLGTAWTAEHFNQLKRFAKHLCFLPDADPPKPNEKFGPGIKAVITSGELAMQNGFSVSVKQIPVTDEKQDPDTYCTSKEIFDDIPERDFILWLASILYEEKCTTVQKGVFVKRIAALLALVEDAATVDMYIAELARKTGNKNLWKKAVEAQKKANAEDEEKEKKDKNSDLFQKYGFNVANGKYYYSIAENGSYYEWSNFIMEPLFHIRDSKNPKRLYRLKNISGYEELIELNQEDLVSISKFKQRIEGLGNYIWKAGEKELTKLKAYLYEQTETAVMITQLGWQRQGFYAFGNGIFHDGNFLKVDDYGIVKMEGKGNYYLPANSLIYRDDIKLFQFERRFIHVDYSKITLRDFTEQIFKVFGDNGRVSFIFLLATLFRDIVTRSTRSFPILNLFGQKGSGKSELGHTLMSFFIIENVPPNIQNSTIAALNDTVASVSNALVHIDEYKNNLDVIKNEFLKGLWDGTGRTKMNMDGDKKKETTSVDSGVILSGQEMPTADIALFSRLIFLSFTKTTFSDDERRDFQTLKKMRVQGMTHLTMEILKMRRIIETDYPAVYQRTMDEVDACMDDMVIEDRILLNWVAPLAAFRCLETHLDTSLSYKLMQEVCVDGIKFQNTQCKQNNELAAFWNMMQFLVSDGEVIEDGDYRIEYVRQLKTNLINVNWSESKAVLYIQKSRIFMLYKKYGKAVGDTLLPEGSLKYYLEHCREYLGEKNSVRYTVYHKGVVQYEKDGTVSREAKTVQRSYCFDYKMLVESFNINFERVKFISNDAPQQEDEKYDPQQEIEFD